MALIKCPECESEISDKAGICPKCGYPISHESETLESNSIVKPKKGHGCLITTIIFLILFMLLVVSLVNCEGNEGPITTYCYWCGKEEECYTYQLQYLEGYNPDGSFKLGYDYKRMSSSCAEKCKNSGKYFNVDKVD